MKYHGQDKVSGGGCDDPLDMVLHTRYFPGFMPGTAVEAGANDGLTISTCLSFEEAGWKVINVEASWRNYEKLIKNRPRSENHFKALSDTNDKIIIINHYDFDNGGMDGENGFPTGLTKGKAPAEQNPVSTIRYDTLIKEPVSLFVLDVEGAELKAITGMDNTTFWPTIFCIEYPHCGKQQIIDAIGGRSRLDYEDSLNLIFVRN